MKVYPNYQRNTCLSRKILAINKDIKISYALLELDQSCEIVETISYGLTKNLPSIPDKLIHNIKTLCFSSVDLSKFSCLFWILKNLVQEY